MTQIPLTKALDFVDNRNLTSSQKMVLFQFMKMQEKSGNSSTIISCKDMGICIELSRRTTERQIDALVAKGILIKTTHRGKGGVNSYIIEGWKA